MALCAQAVLGAAALAAQAHRDVEMPGGLQRPLSVALLAIGPSGERKTTVDTIALKPVREVEHELQTKYELDLASYKNEQAAWEQARKPSGKATKNKTAALADLKAAGDEPTPPRKPIILVSRADVGGVGKAPRRRAAERRPLQRRGIDVHRRPRHERRTLASGRPGCCRGSGTTGRLIGSEVATGP